MLCAFVPYMIFSDILTWYKTHSIIRKFMNCEFDAKYYKIWCPQALGRNGIVSFNIQLHKNECIIITQNDI